MTNAKKHQLGLIGLCVTVVSGFLALSTSAAQAESPKWMVGGSNVSSNLEVSLTAAPEEIEVPGDGKQKVALLLAETSLHAPLWISCSEIKSSGLITLEAEGKATGAVSFNTCKTYLKSGSEMKLSAVCTPTQPVVLAATVEIVLHEGLPYAKASGSEAGGRFGLVKFPIKTACSLEGENYEVKGTLWLEDSSAEFEAEALEHLIREGKAAAAALGGLTFGANPASIDGSARGQLVDGAVMKAFSGLAG